MKTTAIFFTLFAALAAAKPMDVPALSPRAGTVRVQLSNDNTDTAVQANINANGGRNSIKANFGNLGNPVQASSGNIVSGPATCRVFRDAGATQLVATLNSNGNRVSFGGLVNLENGVIACQ